jgi:hypothetical protein
VFVARGEQIEAEIFRRRRKPMSRQALRTTLAPEIAGWLRATCAWGPDAIIGDYRCATLTLRLTPRMQVAFQFWSEPGEPIVWEITSEPWFVPDDKAVAAERARGVEALGFAVAVRPAHYSRDVVVRDDSDLTRFAEAVVDLLYEAFGYRGMQAIKAALAYETRAQMMFTYDSFTPGDLTRILLACGFEVVEIEGDDDLPVLRAMRRGITTYVHMVDRLPGEYLFQRAVLSAEVEVSPAQVRAASELNLDIGGEQPAALQVGTTLIFQGGVTASWIEDRINEWDVMTWSTQRDARRARRRSVRRKKSADRVTVH